MKNLLILLIFGLLTMPLYTIAQFKLGAEIRPRAEFRNGFKEPKITNAQPAFFIEQRSRLNVSYAIDKMEIKLSLQDVRIWGSVSQIYKTDPNLQNVFEAWGKYSFNDNIAIKIGRQALAYDNERFLGALNWAAQGRSHDAILFNYKSNSGLKLDVGLAYNQNWRFEPTWLSGNFYDNTTLNYKTMQFAHLSKHWDKTNLSALIHNDGRQVDSDSSMAYRQTYALIGAHKSDKIDFGGEIYFQGGENGIGRTVNAWLLAAFIKWNTKLTPLTLGVDYLSGTNPGSSEHRSFEPLYGTNHKFYGYMDYFYVGNPNRQKGLTDIYLKSNFKLGKKSFLAAHAHYFLSAAKIEDPNNPGTNLSNALGTEVDLVYTLNLAPSVVFNLGYSQMFSTSSMVEIKGGTGDNTAFNNWMWAMIAFKPTLFDSEKKKE